MNLKHVSNKENDVSIFNKGQNRILKMYNQEIPLLDKAMKQLSGLILYIILWLGGGGQYRAMTVSLFPILRHETGNKQTGNILNYYYIK